jgi:hypothetical protein
LRISDLLAEAEAYRDMEAAGISIPSAVHAAFAADCAAALEHAWANPAAAAAAEVDSRHPDTNTAMQFADKHRGIFGPDVPLRATTPKENQMTNPVAEIESIAKRKGITTAEAYDTPEGAALYRRYKEAQQANLTAPTAPAQRVVDARAFAGDGDALRAVEAEIDERAAALLEREGNFTPSALDLSKATARILEHDPSLYQRYTETHRRAIGGG